MPSFAYLSSRLSPSADDIPSPLYSNKNEFFKNGWVVKTPYPKRNIQINVKAANTKTCSGCYSFGNLDINNEAKANLSWSVKFWMMDKP